MNVLSASRLVVVDAVVDSVAVLWPAVDVAVQWLVVAIVPAVESVLLSLLCRGRLAVQSDLGDLVVVHVTDDSCRSHPVALRLMDSLTCSPVIHCISRNKVTSHWLAPIQSSSFSSLCSLPPQSAAIRHFMSVLGLFPELALMLQEEQICVVLKNVAKEHEGVIPKPFVLVSIDCVAQDFSASVNSPNNCRAAASSMSMSSTVRPHAKISRMVLNFQ